MKRLLTLALIGVFSAALVGCRASAEVDKPDNGDSSMKKTTTVDRNGDTVKKETTIRHD